MKPILPRPSLERLPVDGLLRRSARALALVALLAAASGCSSTDGSFLAQPVLTGALRPTEKDGTVLVDMRSFRIELRPGQQAEIRLPSNPSTGYRWLAVEPLPQVAVLVEAPAFVAGRSDLVGTPGEERWIFRAEKPGVADLKLEYRRPWEPSDLAPAQRASFRFEVK
jgi:inhibitor of cysteine peptidase